jgi:hypothetical protein
MNATETFLGDPEGWTQLRIELHDVHGLWGGRTCFVLGDGRVVAQVASPAQYEDRYAAAVAPGGVVRLVMALIEADFVTITFPLRSLLPDEAYPTILVFNPAGECRRVFKRAGDTHAGFDRVYQLLCEFADRAQQGERLYQGPFDPNFAPA